MIDKFQVVPDTYTKGRRINARIRRENQRIDAAAEAWRNEDVITTTTTMKLDVNGHIIEVERSLAYHLLSSHEARLCLDQSVPVDYISEGAE